MIPATLQARLGIPPRPRDTVDRPRLLRAIDHGIANGDLVVIAAPGGYGKTTLMVDWAQRETGPVAWLSLEPADNDLEQVVRYLVRAWEAVQPEIAELPAGVLMSGLTPAIDILLPALVETATRLDDSTTFVLDDLDVLDQPDVLEALRWLIEHRPPTMRFVIGGRAQPPFPLARFRARRQLTEIGPADLSLTAPEASAWLNDRLALDLPDETVADLVQRMEGWCAGVQLAALTRDRDRPASITGRHHFIADYIREDVLDPLPAPTRDFLVRTSIADRLCGDLADAITDGDDGRAMLESLERQHLFTTPLDANREWYRYHRLFADVLRDELARKHAGDMRELHRRAARWYLLHGMAEPAFDHAMESGEIDAVTEVLETFAQVLMFRGQVRTLLAWYERIPTAWMDASPMQGLFRVLVHLATGQLDRCPALLDSVEQHLGREPIAGVITARVAAMRCFVACFTNDLATARESGAVALDSLVAEDETYRAGVYGAMGDTWRRNGYWEEAHDFYLNAIRHSHTPEGYIEVVHGYGALADLELRQGHLHAAAGYWQKAIERIDDPALWGAYPLPLLGWVHTRFGEILYQWNRLDEARAAWERGHDRVVAGGDPRSIIASGILAARLELATGNVENARVELDAIREHAETAQFSDWGSEFERCQVEAWLAGNEISAALGWADRQDAATLGAVDREPALLAYARVIATHDGDEHDELADRLLVSMLERSEHEGRGGLLVEALAHRALARHLRGDVTGAISNLERALRLGEPERFIRAFVDLDVPMARLLQEARRRKLMPTYVDTLLAAFDAPHAANRPGNVLVEPLSQRELDVLQHLSAGLTNAEIAGLLFISPETVKKHTASIYGKLAVHGRTAAVARARELGLLD